MRGQHVVHVTAPSKASRSFRPAQHAVFHEPVLAFTTASTIWSVPKSSRLASPFPENIGLLTLQPREEGTVLLRLQHLFGVGEDDQLSQPAKIAVADVVSFLGLKVTRVTETSLTANQARAAMHQSRLRWNGAQPQPVDAIDGAWEQLAAADITLNPLQVRTFLLQLA